ncbi:MAG: hypothetical protein ABJN34_07700 [Litoreibacter sp.]|uniref:hypothetical protein n=1 Tax=Litoreibacter sp. TaxID=1969459 RepID=UPI0032969763
MKLLPSRAALTPPCALGIVGHLGESMTASRSTPFKSNFIFLARRYHGDFKRMDAKTYENLQRVIGRAIGAILDDITVSQRRGGMLDVLMLYRINLLVPISKRVDYVSLTQKGFLADWQFNEYATCMGDADAQLRLAQVLEKSGPQDLRLIFTDQRGKIERGSACMPERLISNLARPYLRDARPIQDVDGGGPPVSTYAKELLDAL